MKDRVNYDVSVDYYMSECFCNKLSYLDRHYIMKCLRNVQMRILRGDWWLYTYPSPRTVMTPWSGRDKRSVPQPSFLSSVT